MIKGIIFDCFGVLLVDNLQLMCDDLAKVDTGAVAEVKRLVSLANRGVIMPMDARPLIAEKFGLNTEEYINRVTSGEGRNESLINYIPTLRKKYKTAMLSNIGKGSLQKRFTPNEFEELFDEVVASGEIGYAKPEARAYEIVAERLGVRLDEAVFTDDREVFCEAARSCGMKAILFENTEQFKRDLEKLLTL